MSAPENTAKLIEDATDAVIHHDDHWCWFNMPRMIHAVERLTAERDEERLAARAEGERADVMEHERDWEQEVVNADLWNRLQAAEAERYRLVAALHHITQMAIDDNRSAGWRFAEVRQIARAALAGSADTAPPEL